MPTWNAIGTTIALVTSVSSLAWNWWKERPRLNIVVSWDWEAWPPYPEAGPELRITIANVGGRPVYIGEIHIVEGLLTYHPKLAGWQQELYMLPRVLWHRLRRRRPELENHWLVRRPPDPLILPGANLHRVVQMFDDDSYAPEESWPPAFQNDWRGLHIAVWSQTGQVWRSRPPIEKPRWFVVTPPSPIQVPPGVNLPPGFTLPATPP
jgi:hypothetical protein